RSSGASCARLGDSLMAAIAAIVLDPFRADADSLLTTSAGEHERRRRSLLLRLVLVCTVFLALAGTLPAALLGKAPPELLWAVGVDVLLGLICLGINRLGHSDTAGILFILGCVAVGIGYIFETPAGPQKPELLVYATMSVLILIAGMVLPSWMVWPVAGLVIAVTGAGFLLEPAGTGLVADGSTRGISFGLLVALEGLTAVVSWAAARSATAGVRAAVRAFERERELAALKDQFIIDANHELRTPIMALYGNIEVLRALGETCTPDVHERLLARALASGDAVLRLLGSVLDASAMTNRAPRLVLAPVAVAPLLRSVLETFDPRQVDQPGLDEAATEARHVDLDVPKNLVALADADRVRQILVNLLSNALKYSPPGAPIEVAAVHLPALRHGVLFMSSTSDDRQEDAGYVRISVRDFGAGVPRRDISKLFNRFVRLERDIAGPVRGTGVGLYICRLLAEAMGGRIWVESSGIPGEGSTFSFTLPAASYAAGSPPNETSGGQVPTHAGEHRG
ncbi:MAG: sensor histidine kinase, partial [Ktedonobacterales bacterium]